VFKHLHLKQMNAVTGQHHGTFLEGSVLLLHISPALVFLSPCVAGDFNSKRDRPCNNRHDLAGHSQSRERSVLSGHPLGCGDSLLQLGTREYPLQSPERPVGLDQYFNLLKLLFLAVFLGSWEALVCMMPIGRHSVP